MNKNNSSRDGSSLYGVRLRFDPQGMIESRDGNHRSAAKCLQVARRIVSKRYLRYSSLIFARFQPVFDSFNPFSTVSPLQPTKLSNTAIPGRELVKRKLVKRRDDDRLIRGGSFAAFTNLWEIEWRIEEPEPMQNYLITCCENFLAKTSVLITFVRRLFRGRAFQSFYTKSE